MALTLDGAVPVLGGMGMGTGSGVAAGGGGLVGALVGGALAGGLGRGWGGWGNGYGAAPAATALATDVALNPAFQSLQNQITNLTNTLNTGDIQDSLHNVSDEILTTTGSLQTNIAAGNFTTLNSINGLGRDIVASQNQAALQQLNSFNNLTTTTLQGFNGSAMQIQNSTNQIIAQGTANAAAVAAGFCDISKQISDCCCEIKQKIADDGNATRALINDLNVQSLRDQLAAANNQVSNNQQNQYLLSTILAHLKPVAPVVV